MDTDAFRLGFFNSDITPDWKHNKVKLGGYIRWRKYVSGVLDPLNARGLCIRNVENPRQSIILISAELVGIQHRIAYLARQKISKLTGVPLNNILIHAIHTHSSPDMIGIFPVTIYSDAFHLDVPKHAAMVVVKGFVEAGVKSFRNATEKFKVGYGIGNEFNPPICVQRRPPYESIKEPVRFLKFTDENDVLIALLTNYQGHPTHMPQINTKVTGEYPVKILNSLYETFPTLKFASYFNGFCGDVSISAHKNFHTSVLQGISITEALDLANEGLAELGREIVATMKDAIENTKCEPLKEFQVVSKPVIAEIGRVNPWNKRKNWYSSITERAKAKIKDFKIKMTYVPMYFVLRLFRGDRFPILNVTRLKYKFYHITQFQLFKINNVIIACAPGEPFLIYKKFLEAHAQNNKIICIEMANDTMGYIFPWSFHIGGGYEKTFGIDPTFGKRLFEQMAREIKKMDK